MSSVYGWIIIACSGSLLFCYFPIVLILKFDPEFRGNNAYIIMFQLGVLDCLQLSVHCFTGIVVVSGAKSLPYVVHKIIGAVFTGLWYSMLFTLLFLHYNRFSSIVLQRFKFFSSKPLRTLWFLLCFLNFIVPTTLKCLPDNSYLFDPETLSWKRPSDDNKMSEYTRFWGKIEIFAVVIFSIIGYSGIFLYMTVNHGKQALRGKEWRITVQISGMVVYFLFATFYWYYLTMFVTIDPLIYNFYSAIVWILMNGIQPIVYLLFNQRLRSSFIHFFTHFSPRVLPVAIPFKCSTSKDFNLNKTTLGYSSFLEIPNSIWIRVPKNGKVTLSLTDDLTLCYDDRNHRFDANQFGFWYNTSTVSEHLAPRDILEIGFFTPTFGFYKYAEQSYLRKMILGGMTLHPNISSGCQKAIKEEIERPTRIPMNRLREDGRCWLDLTRLEDRLCRRLIQIKLYTDASQCDGPMRNDYVGERKNCPNYENKDTSLAVLFESHQLLGQEPGQEASFCQLEFNGERIIYVARETPERTSCKSNVLKVTVNSEKLGMLVPREAAGLLLFYTPDCANSYEFFHLIQPLVQKSSDCREVTYGKSNEDLFRSAKESVPCRGPLLELSKSLCQELVQIDQLEDYGDCRGLDELLAESTKNKSVIPTSRPTLNCPECCFELKDTDEGVLKMNAADMTKVFEHSSKGICYVELERRVETKYQKYETSTITYRSEKSEGFICTGSRIKMNYAKAGQVLTPIDIFGLMFFFTPKGCDDYKTLLPWIARGLSFHPTLWRQCRRLLRLNSKLFTSRKYLDIPGCNRLLLVKHQTCDKLIEIGYFNKQKDCKFGSTRHIPKTAMTVTATPVEPDSETSGSTDSGSTPESEGGEDSKRLLHETSAMSAKDFAEKHRPKAQFEVELCLLILLLVMVGVFTFTVWFLLRNQP